MLKKIKAAVFGLIAAAFIFSGCTNFLTENNKSDISYGSLTIRNSESRSIDVSTLKSAKIEIFGSDFTKEITKTVTLTGGKADGITIEGIPAGKNRIVKVQAYGDAAASDSACVDGIILYAITDISSGDGNTVTVNNKTSPEGAVYYALYKADVKTTELTADQMTAISAAVPAYSDCITQLLNTAQFVTDFDNGKGTLGASSSYIQTPATVKVSAENAAGYSFSVNDPYSKTSKTISADGDYTLDICPGKWTLTVLDDSGTVYESKQISSTSGSTVNYILSIEEGGDTFNGIRVNVDKSTYADYKYIWYWSCKDSSGTALAAYPDSSVNYKWITNFEEMKSDDQYYYYEFNGAASVTLLVVTKTGTKLYTTGNDSADGWSFTAPGTYLLSSSGATVQETSPVVTLSQADGATFSTDTFSVTLTAVNCTTAKYTTDGTNPKTSETAVSFSTSKTVTVGSGMSIGDTVTVRVYGTDGTKTSSSSATYTKVEKSATPTRLGAYYTKSSTVFTIWSPDSANVKVSVKKSGESSFTDYTCTAGYTVDGGYSDTANIYGVAVQGDCKLAEYQFYIGGKAVRDPYGRMVKYENELAKTNIVKENDTVDSCSVTSYAGSSINIVMDVDSIEMSDSLAARPALADRAESVVYEVHVGDFTSHSSWTGTESYRGKFEGLTESGTTYTSGSTTVKTGLDHLVELGVTHVQILPMFDYATKVNNTVGDYYNWGYDPVNYNVPEDRFSMDPTDYEGRIREVKDMVNKLHAAGIRVIMDVVYNHTYDGEMFSGISSKYYTATDRSCCGNSVDVTNAMVSRMVRDSLEYWLDTFNLDGFRFDLMGIYTKDAMSDWGTYLNNKFSDRSLLLYGEPYQADHSDTENRVYANLIPDLKDAGIGGFAHKYRETLKGGSDDKVTGYIFNTTNKDGESTVANVQVGLKGSAGSVSSDVWTRYFTASPFQAVNYLAAHDNLCLYDKVVYAGISDIDYQKAIVKFGHGIITLSQGVGFIHGGDDFLRTKSEDSINSYKVFFTDGRTGMMNSYMFGQKMNCINWSRKATYYDTFKYHKDLIAFKKAHDGFWKNNGVSTSADGMVIYYTVKDSDGTTLTCVLNPGNNFDYTGSGTMVFNGSGAVSSSSSKTCQGTSITIFKN